MPEDELSTALTVLRVIRGWNQTELAKAARMHSSAVSTYERGKIVPELRTIERLVSAMGFPLSALDQTRGFIEAVRIHSVLTKTVRSAAVELDLAGEEPVFSRDQLADHHA